MPCLGKDKNWADTAVAFHAFGANTPETRAIISAILRRYEIMFDEKEKIIRARQGAPRNERLRTIDIRGVGQMVGKCQKDRSKVLANVQARRTRTILSSMAKAILRKGGVSEVEVAEGFRPNNLTVAGTEPTAATTTVTTTTTTAATADATTVTTTTTTTTAAVGGADAAPAPLVVKSADICVAWTSYAATHHGNGANTPDAVNALATVLDAYARAFDTWRRPTLSPPPDGKKERARFYAQLQADRNRVIMVAMAKTLIRKGGLSKTEMLESFAPNNLKGAAQTRAEMDYFDQLLADTDDEEEPAEPVQKRARGADSIYGY